MSAQRRFVQQSDPRVRARGGSKVRGAGDCGADCCGHAEDWMSAGAAGEVGVGGVLNAARLALGSAGRRLRVVARAGHVANDFEADGCDGEDEDGSRLLAQL